MKIKCTSSDRQTQQWNSLILTRGQISRSRTKSTSLWYPWPISSGNYQCPKKLYRLMNLGKPMQSMSNKKRVPNTSDKVRRESRTTKWLWRLSSNLKRIRQWLSKHKMSRSLTSEANLNPISLPRIWRRYSNKMIAKMRYWKHCLRLCEQVLSNLLSSFTLNLT